jgi:hypothetical protein
VKRVLIMLGLTTALGSSPRALAQDSLPLLPNRFELGLALEHTTRLDLAKQAGATGYGSGNDVALMSGALDAGMGFAMRQGGTLLEATIEGWIAAGGLDIGSVERRYLAGRSFDIGSSSAYGMAFRERIMPELSPNVNLVVGPSFEFRDLVASSPAGRASAALLGVGLEAGVRWRLHSLSEHASGWLQITVRGCGELPMSVHVDRSTNDPVFSAGYSGHPIGSFGLAASYVITID